MKVRYRLDQLKQDNYIIYHKALGNNALMEDSDWIRIYKSKGNGCIDQFVYATDIKFIDSIPEEILDMEYDYEDSWMLGGYLSLDMVIRME